MTREPNPNCSISYMLFPLLFKSPGYVFIKKSHIGGLMVSAQFIDIAGIQYIELNQFQTFISPFLIWNPNLSAIAVCLCSFKQSIKENYNKQEEWFQENTTVNIRDGVPACEYYQFNIVILTLERDKKITHILGSQSAHLEVALSLMCWRISWQPVFAHVVPLFPFWFLGFDIWIYSTKW